MLEYLVCVYVCDMVKACRGGSGLTGTQRKDFDVQKAHHLDDTEKLIGLEAINKRLFSSLSLSFSISSFTSLCPPTPDPCYTQFRYMPLRPFWLSGFTQNANFQLLTRPYRHPTPVELRSGWSMLYTSLRDLDDGITNMSQSIHFHRIIVADDVDCNRACVLGPSVRDREAGYAGELHWGIDLVAAEDLKADNVEAMKVVDVV